MDFGWLQPEQGLRAVAALALENDENKRRLGKAGGCEGERDLLFIFVGY